MGYNDVKANMEICLKRLRQSLWDRLIYMAFISILKILLKVMRYILPGIFKGRAPSSYEKKNTLQSLKVDSTLPLEFTVMNLICRVWRKVKL